MFFHSESEKAICMKFYEALTNLKNNLKSKETSVNCVDKIIYRIRHKNEVEDVFAETLVNNNRIY